jgi:fermentation-respiration switch protein FrsA (DUF1100 family)
MAVIGVAGERPGTDDQPLFLRDREAHLDAELVGLACLSFPNAFNFRRMQCVELVLVLWTLAANAPGPLSPGIWENSVTVQSTRAARMYEPGTYIARISPTPLLMIVALADSVTVTDLALAAYERALEPRKLVTIAGGHFDPYLGNFEQASTSAISWFNGHLGQKASQP